MYLGEMRPIGSQAKKSTAGGVSLRRAKEPGARKLVPWECDRPPTPPDSGNQYEQFRQQRWPSLVVPGDGRESSCRHQAPLAQDQAVVEVGGGEPGEVLTEAREGAGESGGSPAGELASGGRVGRGKPLCARCCAQGAAPPSGVGAAPAGRMACLSLRVWVDAWCVRCWRLLCVFGTMRGVFAAGGLTAARRGTGGAFPLCLGVERFFQAAGPSPPEAVGVPLGVGVCLNLFLVALICVGLVSRPAVVAENRLRRDIFRTVVANVVVSWVLKRVVVGAVEVDSHRAALAPGH